MKSSVQGSMDFRQRVFKLRKFLGRQKRAYLLKTGQLPLHNPILIYQMGKVASSSIYRSLRKLENHSVYNVHRLNPKNIQETRDFHAASGGKIPDDSLGLYINKHVIQKKVPAKIISLIREPVGRNISAYFENLSYYHRVKNVNALKDSRELMDGFLSHYPHEVPIHWFDQEMNQTLQFDVYQNAFPKEQGHLQLSQGAYDVLIMRYDLNDTLKSELLKEFLKIKEFKIVRENESSQKEYAAVYKEFIQDFKVPRSYVDRLLNSKYANHFFSEEELNRLRARWIDEGL